MRVDVPLAATGSAYVAPSTGRVTCPQPHCGERRSALQTDEIVRGRVQPRRPTCRSRGSDRQWRPERTTEGGGVRPAGARAQRRVRPPDARRAAGLPPGADRRGGPRLLLAPAHPGPPRPGRRRRRASHDPASHDRLRSVLRRGARPRAARRSSRWCRPTTSRRCPTSRCCGRASSARRRPHTVAAAARAGLRRAPAVGLPAALHRSWPPRRRSSSRATARSPRLALPALPLATAARRLTLLRRDPATADAADCPAWRPASARPHAGGAQ